MRKRDKNKGGVVINKTRGFTVVRGAQGAFDVGQQGGSVAKAARQQLESQLGRSVISPLNAKATLSAKKDTPIEVEK